MIFQTFVHNAVIQGNKQKKSFNIFLYWLKHKIIHSAFLLRRNTIGPCQDLREIQTLKVIFPDSKENNLSPLSPDRNAVPFWLAMTNYIITCAYESKRVQHIWEPLLNNFTNENPAEGT